MGWTNYGASVYASTALSGHSPLYTASDQDFAAWATQRIQMAKDMHLSTIRIVNFLDSPNVQDTEDPQILRNLTSLLTMAQAAGLSVIVDLSSIRNYLQSTGHQGYVFALWNPLLDHYVLALKDHTANFSWSLAGEIDPSDYSSMGTQTIKDFYASAKAYFAQHDPNHVVSAGGMLHFNDGALGTLLEEVWALGWGRMDIHVYHDTDVQGMPAVATLAKQLQVPYFVEECGKAQGDGDQQRADWFNHVIGTAEQNGYSGFLFWNLGPEQGANSMDVNTGTPIAYQAIMSHANAAGPVSTPPAPTIIHMAPGADLIVIPAVPTAPTGITVIHDHCDSTSLVLSNPDIQIDTSNPEFVGLESRLCRSIRATNPVSFVWNAPNITYARFLIANWYGESNCFATFAGLSGSVVVPVTPHATLLRPGSANSGLWGVTLYEITFPPGYSAVQCTISGGVEWDGQIGDVVIFSAPITTTTSNPVPPPVALFKAPVAMADIVTYAHAGGFHATQYAANDGTDIIVVQ